MQMKLEKKRSSSMDKIMNKFKSAQRKAQEMRSSISANQANEVTNSSQTALSFHRTPQLGSLSGCFTCHASWYSWNLCYALVSLHIRYPNRSILSYFWIQIILQNIRWYWMVRFVFLPDVCCCILEVNCPDNLLLEDVKIRGELRI